MKSSKYSTSPEARLRQQILAQLDSARAAAEAAHTEAVALNSLILQHRPDLAPGVALLREVAALLVHSNQDFAHRARAALDSPSRNKAQHG